MAFISWSQQKTRASQKGPQTPPSLLQETGNTVSHLGANHKPLTITRSVFLPHDLVRARCSMMPAIKNSVQLRDDSESLKGKKPTSHQPEEASRLTSSIFIPGMAANWFQQEAMVGHGQSAVRSRPGSGLRNQGLVGWEITVKSRKTEVPKFLLRGLSQAETRCRGTQSKTHHQLFLNFLCTRKVELISLGLMTSSLSEA